MICEIYTYILRPSALTPMRMPSSMKDFSYMISAETFKAVTVIDGACYKEFQLSRIRENDMWLSSLGRISEGNSE